MNKNSDLKKFEDYIISKGATPIKYYYSAYGWMIETIYGKLQVSIHDSDFTKAGMFSKKQNLASIFCQFREPEKVPQKFIEKNKLGPSLKYNFHSSRGDSNPMTDSKTLWDYHFYYFQYELEKILPPQ